MEDRTTVEHLISEDLRNTVLSKVSPDPEERRRVMSTAGRLMEAARTAIGSLGVKGVEPVLAGSVAKGTYSRSPDIDIFLLFPPNTTDAELERTGLEIGARVLDDPVRKYTQHPYTAGTFMGIQCDLVPCLKLGKGERVRTAVDRTPHHVDYINSALGPDQREEVLLLKSFLKGIGSYGAEDTVRGFSGYLVELLIITFGSFDGAVRAFSGVRNLRDPPLLCEELGDRPWLPDEPHIVMVPDTIEGPGAPTATGLAERFPRQPLIIVDPVDPRRNVASPVSAQTLAHTARCARSLLERPSIELFHPFSGRPNDLDTIVTDRLAPAGPSVPLVCPLPEANSSMVVTQLRRVLNTCISALKREGFSSVSVELCLIFPKGWAIDQGYTRARWTFVASRVEASLVALRVSADPAELGPTKEHWGPPIDNERAPDFRARWGDRTRQDDASGRLYTIVQRARTRSADLLQAHWSENARGLFEGTVLEPPTDKALERSLASVLGS